MVHKYACVRTAQISRVRNGSYPNSITFESLFVTYLTFSNVHLTTNAALQNSHITNISAVINIYIYISSTHQDASLNPNYSWSGWLFRYQQALVICNTVYGRQCFICCLRFSRKTREYFQRNDYLRYGKVKISCISGAYLHLLHF